MTRVERVFAGFGRKNGPELNAFNDILPGRFLDGMSMDSPSIQWLAYEKASVISESDYGHHCGNHFGYRPFGHD